MSAKYMALVRDMVSLVGIMGEAGLRRTLCSENWTYDRLIMF